MTLQLQQVKQAAEIIARARHAIALTGAGVSTPSGIPDFRGPSGLWRSIPPEVFDISYFHSYPRISWRIFLKLYDSSRGVHPNPAHYSLAWLEENGVLKAIITQNIDGLHQLAGSRRVIELHGNLKHAKCIECGRRVALKDAIMAARTQGLPICPHCSGVLKPDVVFFGEPLPEKAVNSAFDLARRSDVILVAGSSLYVTPARYIPEMVKARGGKVIVVNLGDIYPGVEPDLYIRAPVEEILPLICEEIASLHGFSNHGCRGRMD